jgi:hypothetical protein
MDGFTIIALILTALPTGRLIYILYVNYQWKKQHAATAREPASSTTDEADGTLL